jgi:hypothetical protein
MSTGTCQRLWSSRSGDSWSREYPGQWEVTDRSIKISPRGSEVTEIAMIGAPALQHVVRRVAKWTRTHVEVVYPRGRSQLMRARTNPAARLTVAHRTATTY